MTTTKTINRSDWTGDTVELTVHELDADTQAFEMDGETYHVQFVVEDFGPSDDGTDGHFRYCHRARCFHGGREVACAFRFARDAQWTAFDDMDGIFREDADPIVAMAQVIGMVS